MSDKESADYNIDELVKDIKAKYLNVEVGDRFNGKYRVTTVDSETSRAIFEKLKGLFKGLFLTKRDVKIIFLVAEEIDG